MQANWTRDRLDEIKDREVVDRNGEKIGTVDEVFVDADTNQPEWIGLGTGIFGMSKKFVPIQELSLEGDAVKAPYDKEKVKNEPDIEVTDEGEITRREEAKLCEYFGVSGHSTEGTHRTVLLV